MTYIETFSKTLILYKTSNNINRVFVQFKPIYPIVKRFFLQNIFAVCDLIVQHVLQRSSQHAVAVIEPDDKSVMKYIPSRLFTKV